MRILDAGWGSGALAVEAARRGANVVEMDVSPRPWSIWPRNAPRPNRSPPTSTGAFSDFLSPDLGAFDYVVAMDGLIHYDGDDIRQGAEELAARTSQSDRVHHSRRAPRRLTGDARRRQSCFRAGSRSPAIAPIFEGRPWSAPMARRPRLAGWRFARTHRVTRRFYISEALEARRRA